MGIAKEDAQRIFEPFYTSKPDRQGTGLGLSVCLDLVEDLGGRIRMRSTVGGGTTALVQLPGPGRSDLRTRELESPTPTLSSWRMYSPTGEIPAVPRPSRRSQ